jgi:Family of unknown function (DUF6062)
MSKLIDKHSRTYFDLLEALRQPDCAVCRLINNSLLTYIDMFIYENINNIARRAEIRTSRGFCSIHTNAFMAGYGRLLSLATLEQDVLNDVLRQINLVLDTKSTVGKPVRGLTRKPGALKAFFRSAPQSIREVIKPQRECPLCEYEHSQEKVMLGTLLQFIDDAEMSTAWQASEGLCLPHYYMALGMPGKHDPIIVVEQRVLKEVKHQIDEYVHKRHPEYGDEEMGIEAGSPPRAAKLLSGRIVHKDGRY